MALSDGTLAVAECPEEDDWESAAEGPELDNLPQNAVEDVSGPPIPSMPLLKVVADAENSGTGINLLYIRCLSGYAMSHYSKTSLQRKMSYPTLVQLYAHCTLHGMVSWRRHCGEHQLFFWLP